MAGDVVGSDPKGPQVEEVGTEQVREQCRPEESAGSVSVGQAPRACLLELEAVDGHLLAVGYAHFCRQRKVTWCVQEKD